MSAQELAQEGGDEDGNHGPPDEGVEDHDDPPEDAAVRGAQGACHDGAGPAQEAAEDDEQDEVDDAQGDVGEQE